MECLPGPSDQKSWRQLLETVWRCSTWDETQVVVDHSQSRAHVESGSFLCYTQLGRLIHSQGWGTSPPLPLGEPIWENESSLEWLSPLPHSQESCNIALHCGQCLLVLSDPKAWLQLLEAVDPAAPNQEMGKESSSLRSKASVPVWSRNLKHGSACVTDTEICQLQSSSHTCFRQRI